METYRDASQPVEARAKDLILKMTLDEKTAQLGSIWSREVLEDGKFSPRKAEALIENGIGQISRPGAATTLTPEEIAEFMNDAQHFLVTKTRLGIPAMNHEECLSGLMAKGATIFPQMIGMASTWEPELLENMTRSIRDQLRRNLRRGSLSHCRNGDSICKRTAGWRFEEWHHSNPQAFRRPWYIRRRTEQGTCPYTVEIA